MFTAFQPNAFQTNAYQIVSNQERRGPGGIDVGTNEKKKPLPYFADYEYEKTKKPTLATPLAGEISEQKDTYEATGVEIVNISADRMLRKEELPIEWFSDEEIAAAVLLVLHGRK